MNIHIPQETPVSLPSTDNPSYPADNPNPNVDTNPTSDITAGLPSDAELDYLRKSLIQDKRHENLFSDTIKLSPELNYVSTLDGSYNLDEGGIVRVVDNRIDIIIKTSSNTNLEDLGKLDIQVNEVLPFGNLVKASIPLDYYKTEGEDQLAKINQIDGITLFEPDYYYTADFVPNDPLYSSDQYGPQNMNTESAWGVTLGSHNIRVAVIDTGIDYTHVDLADNYLDIGYDWVNSDSDPMDDNNHGTHVAGTIAGDMNNGIGVAGMANVSIFAEKFLASSGAGSTSGALQSIYHALDNGAQILSNSWGGGAYSSLLQDAIDDVNGNGSLFIAAAGNDAETTPHYPAAYDGVIAVGAVNQNNELATFSNYGDWVDIVGPGVDIMSTIPGGYANFSGTSMATPHISGQAALIWSNYQSATASEIEAMLLANTIDFGIDGRDEYFALGMPDSFYAIQPLETNNLEVFINMPSVLPEGETVEIEYLVYNFGTTTETSISFTSYTNEIFAMSEEIASLIPGEFTSFNLPVTVNPSQTYNFTAVVETMAGETKTADNKFTSIMDSSTQSISLQTDDVISYYAYGANNDPWTYYFQFENRISPTEYNMSIYLNILNDDPYLWYVNQSIDVYTREWNGLVGSNLFHFTIPTGLQVSDIIQTYMTQYSSIVGSQSSYNYFGQNVDMFAITSEAVKIKYYDKTTGIMVNESSTNAGDSIRELRYNSVFGSDVVNGIISGIMGSVSPNVGSSREISVQAYNGGFSTETFVVDFYANNILEETVTLQLTPNEDKIFSINYVTSSIGIFNFTVQLRTISGESHLEDNTVTRFFSSDLHDYGPLYTEANWASIATDGKKLDLAGDDELILIYTNKTYSVYNDLDITWWFISTNGFVSPNSDPGHQNQDFPTSFGSDLIAPFWYDLVVDTTSSVYIYEATDYFGIEWQDIETLSGNLVGSFQVQIYHNGSIQFNYQLEPSADYPSTIGLNKGDNIHFTQMQNIDISGQTSVRFDYDISGTELFVDLEHTPLYQNKKRYLDASIHNYGPQDVFDIDLYIEYNKTVVYEKIGMDLEGHSEFSFEFSINITELTMANLTIYTTYSSDSISVQNNKLTRLIAVEDPITNLSQITIDTFAGGVPSSDVKISLYRDRNDSGIYVLYDTQISDINYEVVFEGVELGTYKYMTEMSGYYNQSGTFNVDVSASNYFYSGFVSLVEIFPHTISITNLDTDIVSGSAALLEYTMNNESQMSRVTTYVNDIYIDDTNFFDRIVVPLDPGTNNITIQVEWDYGAVYTLTKFVETTNYIQPIPISLGDQINWRYTNSFEPDVQYDDFNFTFTKQVDPYLWNVSLDVVRTDYYGSVYADNTYYLIINVANGQVKESNMWWEGMHFFFFPGFTNLEVGDKIAYWAWDNVLYLNGTSTENGFDVYTGRYDWLSDTVHYYDINSGLHVAYRSLEGDGSIEYNYLTSTTLDLSGVQNSPPSDSTPSESSSSSASSSTTSSSSSSPSSPTSSRPTSPPTTTDGGGGFLPVDPVFTLLGLFVTTVVVRRSYLKKRE